MLSTQFDSSVPCHFVNTLARSGSVEISMTYDHAPDRIISFLYDGAEFHNAIMALNSKSPLSVRQGDLLEVYDKVLLGSLVKE